MHVCELRNVLNLVTEKRSQTFDLSTPLCFVEVLLVDSFVSFPCRAIPIFLPALSIEKPGNFASVLLPLEDCWAGIVLP